MLAINPDKSICDFVLGVCCERIIRFVVCKFGVKTGIHVFALFKCQNDVKYLKTTISL